MTDLGLLRLLFIPLWNDIYFTYIRFLFNQYHIGK